MKTISMAEPRLEEQPVLRQTPESASMHVLVLAPALYDTSPGQRFRIEQWARHLEKAGLRFTHLPFEDQALHDVLYQKGRQIRKAYLLLKALARRFALLPRVRKFDLVYVSREATLLGPAFIERLVAFLKVPLVFDFDDAIWVPYRSPANKWFSYLKCFGKTATLCRISRHVLAGNPYLAEYARQYNRHVSVIPTTIDPEVYSVRPADDPTQTGPITIGWTGSYSTVQHLDTLRPALLQLRRRCPFRLLVIGTPSYTLDGVDVVARPWQASSEVADLHQFDIGLMPLPDDNWSRGKCGLKMLQCMGVGVPVVASPVGVNRDMVQDGVNGFLAATEEEWVTKLDRLIHDARLRRDMGLMGRQTVEQHYAAGTWAERVRNIFEQVLSTTRRSI
jgi:glycosyltransferase involved in cell wall biosynthesis